MEAMRLPVRKLISPGIGIEDLIAEFEHLAECPDFDVEQKRMFTELARIAKQLPEIESQWEAAAEQFGVHDLCRGLSTEEIACYIVLPQDGEESNLQRLLRERLVEPLIPELHNSFHGSIDDFLAFMCGVFNTALLKECTQRQAQNETDDGRAIRQLLVKSSEQSRGELLQNLAESITPGLFFQGEIRWQSEEAPAEAAVAIWERVASFATSSSCFAANPEALRKSMDGELNKVLEQARSRVRTMIETDNRRHNAGPEMRILSEVTVESPGAANQETKVLFEQLLSRTELKLKDKELARFCLLEGSDQKEAATRLGISQGYVSKRIKFIRANLKKALATSTQISEPL